MNDHFNILVPGGAGFIGSNFIIYMLNLYKNIMIVNYDKLTYAANLNYLAPISTDPRYLFVKGDICDGNLLRRVIKKYKINYIVNFAAETHVDRSIYQADNFIKSNIVGTQILLEAALSTWQHSKSFDIQKCRFHHISTDEVYGSLTKNDPGFTENSPYQPNSPYAASKASSDHLVRAYYKTYHLPITISNCSNNFGTNQHPEKFIPTIVAACQKQKPIPIYGDGTNIRDWIFVNDHLNAINKILHEGKIGESFNVGGNNEISNLDLVYIICGIMDEMNPASKPHSQLISFVKDRPGHDWRYAIDDTKIKKNLHWMPKNNFIANLKETLNYYCENKGFFDNV